jgi:hypothetical protein
MIRRSSARNRLIVETNLVSGKSCVAEAFGRADPPMERSDGMTVRFRGEVFAFDGMSEQRGGVLAILAWQSPQ